MTLQANAQAQPATGEPQDQAAQHAWQTGDHRHAVTLILEAHGSEVHAYIRGVSQPKLADDIFGQVVLDLWLDIRRFQWRCTTRTYLFALARHAIARVHKLESRASRRERAYAESTWLGDLVTEPRSPTPHYLRSEVKLRVRALRERLTDEEQTLLVLRIDRRMSFNDLAVVMSAVDHSMSTREQRRIAARLRKRFSVLKSKLRAMMIEDGLLDATGETPPHGR